MNFCSKKFLVNTKQKKVPPDFSGGTTKNHGVIFSNPDGGTAWVFLT